MVAKRIFQLFGFLLLAGVIYASGAYVFADYSTLVTPTPPIFETPPPTDDIPAEYADLGLSAVIEYGHSELILHNNDPIHAYIRYPQAGNPTDAPIYEWAHTLYEGIAVHYNTGIDFGPADFGEINVQFDSYLIDNRYAGVFQLGEYSYNMAEHPQEIIKTFNIELTEFKFLEPSDILDYENLDSILSLLSIRLLVEHPRTDGYHLYMDESWLSYLVITHEGIVVILPHNEFLPDSFPTMTVTLPYLDLGSNLLIRTSAPLPAIPNPTPEPTPEPSPTPTPTPDAGEDSQGGEPDENEDEGFEEGFEDEPIEEEPIEEEPIEEEPIEEEPPPVEIPTQSSIIDFSKPIIALSFDNGPGVYTEQFLDLLERHRVRATFCVIGNLVDSQSDSLRRITEIGSEVIGRSWNHKNLAKMNADDVRLQIEATSDAIEAITGTTIPMFRPPYGAVSDTMRTVAEDLGLVMINWSVDPEDWKQMNADHIYEQVLEQVRNGSIILSHEVYKSTLEAYERLIPELLLQGYQIVSVSEFFRLKEITLTPGLIYTSASNR